MSETKKEKQGYWKKGDFSGFFYTKTENFDFDEYSFLSIPEKAHLPQFTAQLTKPKGEKPTDEDIALAFADELFQEMTDSEFGEKNANCWFEALPPEFYTQQTYEAICKKMVDFELKSPTFETERLEHNLSLFKKYAHKTNPKEIDTGHAALSSHIETHYERIS